MALFRCGTNGEKIADTVNFIGKGPSNSISLSNLKIGDKFQIICGGTAYAITNPVGAVLLDDGTDSTGSFEIKIFLFEATATTFTASTNGGAYVITKINE